MRPLQKVALVCGAFVILLVAGVIVLVLTVNPNQYRGRIQQAVQTQTGRQLTIGGPLELKLFPWLALSVRNLTLGNAPGYGPAPFLTVEHASIGVKLLPLIAKRLEVSRVTVEGLAVNLVSRGNENNWKDLSESEGSAQHHAPAQPAANTGSTGSASVGGVEIRNAVLTYSDEVKKSTTKISIVDFHTSGLQLGSRTELDGLDLKATLQRQSPDQPPAAARPIAFELHAHRLAVDPRRQTLGPSTIDMKLGELAAVVTVSVESLDSNHIVSGNLTIPSVSLRKVLESLGESAPVTRDTRALSAFALKSSYRLTSNQLQLADLDLTLDDTHLKGTAAIDDLERMAVAFELNVDGINLDRYRPPAPPQGAKKPTSNAPVPAHGASAQTPAATPLPVDALRKLNIHGALKVGSATYANLLFTDVVSPLDAKDGRVHLGPTQARVYGGTYDGDIVLDARATPAQLSVTEHLHGTDLGALMKAAYDTTRIVGHADANVVVSGSGNTNVALTQSLAGKIDANVQQGAINGIDLGYALQSANALLKHQGIPQAPGSQRTPFKTLRTTATLEKGILRTDELSLETDVFKVSGKGTLDTTSEAIDYQLLAAVTDGQRGGQGGLSVPLRVTGTAESPTVRPDLEALAKGQLREQVQQKAGDLVKKQLKDLLSH